MKRKQITTLDSLFLHRIDAEEYDEAKDMLETGCVISNDALDYAIMRFVTGGYTRDESLVIYLKYRKRKLTRREALRAIEFRINNNWRLSDDTLEIIQNYKLPTTLLDKYIPTAKRITGSDKRRNANVAAKFVDRGIVLKAILRSLQIRSLYDRVNGPDVEMASNLAKAAEIEIPSKPLIRAFKCIIEKWGLSSVKALLAGTPRNPKVIDAILRATIGMDVHFISQIEIAQMGASPEMHQELIRYLIEEREPDTASLKKYARSVKGSLDAETLLMVGKFIARDFILQAA